MEVHRKKGNREREKIENVHALSTSSYTRPSSFSLIMNNNYKNALHSRCAPITLLWILLTNFLLDNSYTQTHASDRPLVSLRSKNKISSFAFSSLLWPFLSRSVSVMLLLQINVYILCTKTGFLESIFRIFASHLVCHRRYTFHFTKAIKTKRKYNKIPFLMSSIVPAMGIANKINENKE